MVFGNGSLFLFFDEGEQVVHHAFLTAVDFFVLVNLGIAVLKAACCFKTSVYLFPKVFWGGHRGQEMS